LFEVTQSLAAQGFSIATLPVSGASELNRGDVYPTNSVPVLMEDGGALTVAMMTWGYPGYPDHRRPGSSPRPLINARAESVYTSVTWRDSIARRRCVIPARGFYEWDTKKTKHLFSQSDGGIMLMAGIYEDFRDNNGMPQRRFAILTRVSAAPVDSVHDRMPVIIPRERVDAWLRGTAEVDALGSTGVDLQTVPVAVSGESPEQLSLF
jgi:putative SOS response-associated peptidase YedK